MIKRFFSIFLILIGILIPTCITTGAIDENSFESEVLTLTCEENFISKIDEISSSTAVVTDDQTLVKQDPELIKEIVENGTSVLVKTNSLELIDDYIDVSQDNKYVTGVYLHQTPDGMITTFISNEPVYDVNYNVSLKEYETDLFNVNQEYVDIQTSLEELKNTDMANYYQSTQEPENKLQDYVSMIKKAFAKKSSHFYFMKKGSTGGVSTDYIWYESDSNVKTISIGGITFSTIGAMDLSIAVEKVKTSGTTTYNRVYGRGVASAISDKKVLKFNVALLCNTQSTKILNQSKIKSTSNKTYTSTMSATVDSDGNLSISPSISYTYNSNSMDVANQSVQNKERSWIVTTNDPLKGADFEIDPFIDIKTTKGTTTETDVCIYCDCLKLSGRIRSYTLKARMDIHMKFKNHKKVA